MSCFAIAGLYAWFNSNDHLPPHFHLEDTQGTWEVMVRFLMEGSSSIEIARGAGPRGKLKRQILRAVDDHRAQLLAEWEAKALPTSPGSLR